MSTALPLRATTSRLSCFCGFLMPSRQICRIRFGALSSVWMPTVSRTNNHADRTIVQSRSLARTSASIRIVSSCSVRPGLRMKFGSTIRV
ncbi:hypothetical protein [Nonomuraea sp. SYSU D8015]|uniref:hypothetical protein n=1 Tax=Nonomuraea sp. SYSU D8015 TaxID=2593644 RepID=UPI001CB7188D|nr:hypothetical protein [Nonomuraea sp. SYSU D8015]